MPHRRRNLRQHPPQPGPHHKLNANFRCTINTSQLKHQRSSSSSSSSSEFTTNPSMIYSNFTKPPFHTPPLSFPSPPPPHNHSATATTAAATMYSYFPAQMPTFTPSSLFATYASISAMVMLLRSVLNDIIPYPARAYILSLVYSLFRFRSSKLTLVIEETNGTGIGRNHYYDAAELYLATKVTTPSTDRLKISKSSKDKSPTIRFEPGEQINDCYEGVHLRWRFGCLESGKGRPRSFEEDPDSGGAASVFKTRFFELSFDKEFRNTVMNSYLPYVEAKYKTLKEEDRDLKIYTLGHRTSYGNVFWDATNLDHPSTFDTLAMDPDRKEVIKDDLNRFIRRREFYRRVGRAWKRGYLLFGPPGTGKSSLIAAMANHLRFDIYDLQLTNLMRDSELRRVLVSIPNRSILVIEDIDCTVEIKDRRNNSHQTGGSSPNGSNHNSKNPEPQLSLSGLLNFIDGLWSSCGDERLIVFTTNHKDKLDPALLRPGRMDMHIEMSYLTVQGFRILASNYLDIKGGYHKRFDQIEELIDTIKVTPAQVAEELMRSEDINDALQGVLKLLESKEKENKEGVVKVEGVDANLNVNESTEIEVI